MSAKLMIKQFFKKDFTKNILMLSTGSAIAAFVSFVFSPVITRFFSPENFGLFSLFTTVVLVISQIVTLRYERAIMLPPEENDSSSLYDLCIKLSLSACFIFVIIFLLIDTKFIFTYFGIVKLCPYRFVIIAVIFLTSFSASAIALLNKRKKYSVLSKSKILLSLTSTAGKLLFGFKGLVSMGLILGFLAGVVINSAYLFFNIVKLKNNKNSVKSIKAMAARYIEFPKFILFSDITNILSHNIHIILLLKFYNAETVGIVAFASTLIKVPLSLLSSSFSQVYYQKISEIFETKKLKLIHKKSIQFLFSMALVVIIILFLIPNHAVSYIFGDKWNELGAYLPYLGIWFAFGLASSPISTIFFKLEKLKFIAFYNLFNLLVTVLVIYTCAHLNYAPLKTVLILSLIKAAMYLFYSLYGYICIGKVDLSKLK